MQENIPGTEEGISRRDFFRKMAVGAGALGLASSGLKTRGVEASSIEKSKLDRHLKGIVPLKTSIPNTSLGATEGSNPEISYPRAVKEGGIITSGNFNFKVTYEGGVFDTVTYLNSPQEEGLPRVGDVLPYLYFFKKENLRESVSLDNFVMKTKGTKSKEIELNSSTFYAVMPIVTMGSNSDIVDVGNTSSSGFTIDSDNAFGTNKGHLSFALLQLGAIPNADKTFGLQMLGVVDNSTKGGGIFLDDNLPDKEIIEKYNIGK